MQSVKPKGQSKTDSHWVDSAVDSQSEAAVLVKFTKKRQPITAEQLKPHWLLKMRQPNQYTESYEPIEIKIHNHISNEIGPCVFVVPACLYHVIMRHTRLIGAEHI